MPFERLNECLSCVGPLATVHERGHAAVLSVYDGHGGGVCAFRLFKSDYQRLHSVDLFLTDHMPCWSSRNEPRSGDLRSFFSLEYYGRVGDGLFRLAFFIFLNVCRHLNRDSDRSGKDCRSERGAVSNQHSTLQVHRWPASS